MSTDNEDLQQFLSKITTRVDEVRRALGDKENPFKYLAGRYQYSIKHCIAQLLDSQDSQSERVQAVFDDVVEYLNKVILPRLGCDLSSDTKFVVPDDPDPEFSTTIEHRTYAKFRDCLRHAIYLATHKSINRSELDRQFGGSDRRKVRRQLMKENPVAYAVLMCRDELPHGSPILERIRYLIELLESLPSHNRDTDDFARELQQLLRAANDSDALRRFDQRLRKQIQMAARIEGKLMIEHISHTWQVSNPEAIRNLMEELGIMPFFESNSFVRTVLNLPDSDNTDTETGI